MKRLDAKRKGEHTYDYKNDILMFKVRDRWYSRSIDFENITLDIDREGFITGIRVFDASKVFGLSRLALNSIKNFEFSSRAENKVITVQLKFTSVLRNKPIIQQGQDFVREAIRSRINDSEVLCTVA